jgi:hypothetical protein
MQEFVQYVTIAQKELLNQENLLMYFYRENYKYISLNILLMYFSYESREFDTTVKRVVALPFNILSDKPKFCFFSLSNLTGML